MTAPVFVDANVLLYARDLANPVKKKRAEEWLAYLWRERLGRTSVQVLSECYVNLTRKRSFGVPQEAAWDEVSAFFAWGPHPADEPLLRRTREVERRYRLSWWDSMIVAAAQLQDCAVLLTEDLQDGALLGTVTVRSPFTLIAGEPSAGYAIPALRSRHRTRGRPRRTLPA